MIPLKITAEEYVKHFPPAAEFILVRKLHNKHRNVRGIEIPQSVLDQQGRFIAMAEILAVSDLVSTDESIEMLKKQMRLGEVKYVGFSFHIVADIVVLPEFELPKDEAIHILHVQDVAQYSNNLSDLYDRFDELQKVEAQRELEAAARIAAEREKSVVKP